MCFLSRNRQAVRGTYLERLDGCFVPRRENLSRLRSAESELESFRTEFEGKGGLRALQQRLDERHRKQAREARDEGLDPWEVRRSDLPVARWFDCVICL